MPETKKIERAEDHPEMVDLPCSGRTNARRKVVRHVINEV
jgi:hypothetical protein